MTPPAGWSVTLCDGFDTHGHALYMFSGGEPIPTGGKVRGRLEIDTNGLTETTNPTTDVTVPPLSVVFHVAQQQQQAECSFDFGPSRNGEWGIRTIATAHLPVPASATWAKALLALSVTLAGTVLLFNARRNAGWPPSLNLAR